jgi:hypothetical protein
MSPAAGPRLWWLRAAVAVVKRPDLWGTAAGQARALSARRWWRTWPPLPRPARQWLEFRMETAYGDRHARPPSQDVLTWLRWCRETHTAARRRRGGG